MDPLATGLLIICAGKMTKQIENFMGQEKEYTGTFVLGKTTESFDLEKPIEKVKDPSNISKEELLEAVKKTHREYRANPSDSFGNKSRWKASL